MHAAWLSFVFLQLYHEFLLDLFTHILHDCFADTDNRKRNKHKTNCVINAPDNGWWPLMPIIKLNVNGSVKFYSNYKLFFTKTLIQKSLQSIKVYTWQLAIRVIIRCWDPYSDTLTYHIPHNKAEDTVSVDFFDWHSTFTWVAVTWNDDRIPVRRSLFGHHGDMCYHMATTSSIFTARHHMFSADPGAAWVIRESRLILGLRPANERRRYKVTPSPIGWAQTWNQPWGISNRCVTRALT